MSSSVVRLPGGRVAVPGNRWDLAPPPRPGAEPFVSVVVPYYDSPSQLGLVLEGLALQDYPADRMEIIVVDDGSPTPLTLPGTDRRGVGLRALHQEDRGFRAAAARNRGARAARGEVLCFLDQDTVPEPAYLRHLVRLPAVLPDALVVGRRRHADLGGFSPDDLRSWLTGRGPAPEVLAEPGWLKDGYRASADLLDSDDTSYRYVISAVMTCTASLFAELGGFDESFTGYGGEDWELAFRAYNAGAVLAHEPAAVAWHDGPEWSGRGDDDSRADDRTRQRAALARRIPEPVLDGVPPPGSGPGPASLVLTWTGTSTLEPARLRAAVSALLDSPLQPVVYLDPGERDRCDPAAGDERVRTTPVPDDVLARALDLIELSGDADPRPDDLTRMHDLLRSGTVGRVRLPGHDPAVTATSLRARRRAARWQQLAGGTDLLELLFGSRTATR